MKFEDRSPEEIVRQGRCARGDAWELAEFSKAQKKRKTKATFDSPSEEWDFAGRIHNKPRGKRVCGRFRSKHAHGQQERLEQSRIGDREDIEKSDNGSDSQR